MKKIVLFLIALFVTTIFFAQNAIDVDAYYSNVKNKKSEYKGSANVQDSLALVALYNATNGDNWSNNSNWLTGNLVNWYGLKLNSNGNVTYLNLRGNNLYGTIPIDFCNLPYLDTLWLSESSLYGKIPPEIGNLTKLKWLTLSTNNLSGEIPVEIANLSNLQYLSMYENQLTGKIPSQIGDMDSLRTINVRNNILSGSIPNTIGNLSKLQNVFLHTNQLIGTIPEELFNCSDISRLYLNDNKLSGTIPVEIENLSKLLEIKLNNNQLSGIIPEGIGNLTNLIRIDFSSNVFTDIPDLSDLTVLIQCNIADNKFDFENFDTARIPIFSTYNPQARVNVLREEKDEKVIFRLETKGSANEYQWFNSSDTLIGEKSDTLAVDYTENDVFYCEITNPNYPNLTLYSNTEYVGNSGITNGVYTAEYDALISFYNSTNGDYWFDNTNWKTDEDVSYWFGIRVEDFHVTVIYMENNNLSGTLVSDFGDLSYLYVLYLNSNFLNGAIPTEFANLSNLEYVWLIDNQISDLPNLSTLTNINTMYVQNNQLEFDDLEPNMHIPLFVYSPQALVGNVKHYTPSNGDNLSLQINSNGNSNTYIWYKDEIIIPNATNSNYTIYGYNNSTDAGTYYCKIRNTVVIGLELNSAPFYVGEDVDEYTITTVAN